MVEILVGPSGSHQKTFHIPRTVLCNGSGYFQTCLSGKWAEGNHGPIKLDDVDPKVFACCALWLYSYKLQDNRDLLFLTKVYQLAERLSIFGLKDGVVSGFCEFIEEMSPPKPITDEICHNIFATAAPRSGFRRVITVGVAWELMGLNPGASKFESEIETVLDCHPEVAREVMLDMAKQLKNFKVGIGSLSSCLRNPFQLDIRGKCFFHDHADAEKVHKDPRRSHLDNCKCSLEFEARTRGD